MTMRLVSYVLLMVLCFGFVAISGVIKTGSFQATSDGANVTLRWLTEDETNVARFEIERRAGVDGDFSTIGTITPNASPLYEFIDYSAFRKVATVYQYRIKVSFTNGATPIYVGPLTVNHTVSGVRRTWGSIKAMFR